ncbi:MAG: hypothetical protein NWQ46_03135, partial [Spirosomaceae bacterium]|nr:hypothetical protein [Spirosomataceae bacterium]
MIADKILTHAETQPDKLAMSWRGERVTYAEIRNLVNVLSVELSTKSNRYFIESDSPITAIVQLLACQLTENIGLIVSKEMPISERKKLIESYQFCVFA